MSDLAADAALLTLSWRQQAPDRLVKTLRLTATASDVWRALCDLQAGRHKYVWGGAIAITKAIDPDAVWVTRRTSKGVLYTDSRRLRQVRRALLELIRRGLIRRVTQGGGSVEGGAGAASAYALGAAVDRYWMSQKRPLRVLPNSDAHVTVSSPDTVTSTSLLNSDIHAPQSSSSLGSIDPSSSSGRRRGKGAAGQAGHHELIRDGAPGGHGFTAIGSMLNAGPQAVPSNTGAIGDLLATPLTRPEITLDLPAPKKRRR